MPSAETTKPEMIIRRRERLGLTLFGFAFSLSAFSFILELILFGLAFKGTPEQQSGIFAHCIAFVFALMPVFFIVANILSIRLQPIAFGIGALLCLFPILSFFKLFLLPNIFPVFQIIGLLCLFGIRLLNAEIPPIARRLLTIGLITYLASMVVFGYLLWIYMMKSQGNQIPLTISDVENLGLLSTSLQLISSLLAAIAAFITAKGMKSKRSEA